MYNVLIKLIVAAALVELGISLSRDGECGSRVCWDQVGEGGRKMLRIDWRPISIFPEEYKKPGSVDKPSHSPLFSKIKFQNFIPCRG